MKNKEIISSVKRKNSVKVMLVAFFCMLYCIPILGQTISSNSVEDMEEVDADRAAILYEGKDLDLSWTIDENGLLTITGTGDYQVKVDEDDSGSYWVVYQTWQEYVDIIKSVKLNITGITTMDWMFEECTNLESVDMTGLDASQVTTMRGMFSECTNLESVDMTGLDTSQVTNMSEMFNYCPNLVSVDLSGLNLSKLTDVDSMFARCSNLEKVNLLNTVGACPSNMSCMFWYCGKLESLDLSTWNLTKAAEFSTYAGMLQAFEGCESLKTILLPEAPYVFEKTVTEIKDGIENPMDFYEYLEIELPQKAGYHWVNPEGNACTVGTIKGKYVLQENENKVSIVEGGTQGRMLWTLDSNGLLKINGNEDKNPYCRISSEMGSRNKVKRIEAKMSGLTRMDMMFDGMENLVSVSLEGTDYSQVTDMLSMFRDCIALESIDLGTLNTKKLTINGLDYMFYDCISLKEVDFSTLDMSAMIAEAKEKNYNSFSLYPFGIMKARQIGKLEKVFLPDLSAYEIQFDFPMEDGYYWKKEGTNTCVYYSYLWFTKEGGTYVRVKGDPPRQGQTRPIVVKGTVLKAQQVTTTDGKVPANSTFTVTSSDAKNPTASFDGVADVNAKAVEIPKTITYNGVTYKVTTVSPTAYTSTGDEAKFKVTDNRVESLTVTYTAPTNKKKTKVTIPTYSTYKGIKFKVTKVSAKAFKNNKKLKQISIATSITDIGADAFSGCTNLQTVTIGKSLKTIGNNAFKNCKKLTKITIKSTRLKNVGKSALKGVNAKCVIKVPKAKLSKYKNLFKNKGQKKTVKITK